MVCANTLPQPKSIRPCFLIVNWLNGMSGAKRQCDAAAIDSIAEETNKNCQVLPNISSIYAVQCGNLLDHYQ